MDVKNFIKTLTKLIDQRVEAKVKVLVESQVKQILEQFKKSSNGKNNINFDEIISEAKKVLPDVRQEEVKQKVKQYNLQTTQTSIEDFDTTQSVRDLKNVPDRIKQAFNRDYSNEQF